MRNSSSFNAASLKKALSVCALAALCLAAGWLIRRGVFDDAQTADNPAAAYEIARQIRYSFTIQNTTSQLIENAVFRTWAPAKQTPTQLCTGIDASDPFRILADDLGNQVQGVAADFGHQALTFQNIAILALDPQIQA